MDDQKQLMVLLDQCQRTWVELQSESDSDTINQYKKELRKAIKQLVQLQDDYDDIHTTEGILAWEERVQSLSQQVETHLAPILIKKVAGITPVSSPAKQQQLTTEKEPAGLKESNIFSSPFSQSRFTAARPSPSVSTPWTVSSQEDHVIREFQTLSLERHHSHQHTLHPPSPLQHPSSSSLSSSLSSSSAASSIDGNTVTPLSKSNSSLSMYSLPANVIDAPMPQQTLTTNRLESVTRQHSLTGDELPGMQQGREKRSKLTIPLFKNISSSYSSPIPGAMAQINFYKSDANGNKAFASDAIVNHPLRIGVGYGSYICYSCTVFSNKGAPITIRKRYSDFVDIRQQLLKRYPNMKSIPKLPPKKIVKKFDPAFIEQRRRDLEYFFKYIVLHPTLGSSPVVKQWIAPSDSVQYSLST